MMRSDELYNAVVNMIARGNISKSTVQDDGTVTVSQSAMDDDDNDDDELFQQYGMASVPLPDAETITIFVGGDREHGIVIGVEDNRYRLKGMKGGEVALYTDEGDFVHFKRDNEISVKTKKLNAEVSTKTVLDCPDVEMTGNLKVNGNVEVTGNIDSKATVSGIVVKDAVGALGTFRTAYSSHFHICPDGATGGPQGQPPA